MTGYAGDAVAIVFEITGPEVIHCRDDFATLDSSDDSSRVTLSTADLISVSTLFDGFIEDGQVTDAAEFLRHEFHLADLALTIMARCTHLNTRIADDIICGEGFEVITGRAMAGFAAYTGFD